MRATTKRTGAQTRAEAQRVALALFSTKGFEATSLREIAAQLGVSKAALYHHFASKEALVHSILTGRGDEAEALLAWARTQRPGPALLREAVLRWVCSNPVEKLQGVRFMLANPALLQTMQGDARKLTRALESLARLVVGKGADPARRLLVRMAFLSVNSAVMAARGTPRTDEQIVEAAKQMALALLGSLGA